MLLGLALQLLTLLVAVLKGVVSLTLLSQQGPQFYATLSQFLVLATFLGSVLSLQLDAATVRFAAAGQLALARVLSGNLLCVGLVGGVLIGLMLLLGGQLSPWVFGHPGWRGPMVLAAISSLLTALLLICASSLQALAQFRPLAVLQISQYLGQIAAIAWSVRYGHEVRVMQALVVADALMLLLFLGVLLRRHGLARPDLAYLRQALPFALPLLISFFLTWLIHASGRFVLVQVQGLSAVAPYAATFTMAALTGLLTPPFVNVLYPLLARQVAQGESSGLLGRTLGFYLLLSLPLLVLMVWFGQTLVELASGPGFYAGPWVMAGLACGFLCTGMTRLAGLALLTGDKTRLMMYSLAWGALLNGLVMLLGAATWGALALAAGYALGFALPLLLILRRVGASALQLRARPLLRAGLRTGAALALMLLCLQWLPALTVQAGSRAHAFMGLLGQGALAMLTYAAGLLLAGQLRLHDLRPLIAALRRRLLGRPSPGDHDAS